MEPRTAPVPRTFFGKAISLAPMDVARDVAELYEISHCDEEARALWRYMPIGPFASEVAMAEFYTKWSSMADVIAFTVREAETGKALGSISLMCVCPEHGRAELGNIWYTPRAQRSKANTEANFLLLRFCFEELHYRRMEWKCNTNNKRSWNAALRLGYVFEGVFRQHLIVKGENRDTAWLSIIDSVWPAVGKAMHTWLYEDDSQSLAALRGVAM
jgi:RimJ/RimL family protein N-acetyltransferase